MELPNGVRIESLGQDLAKRLIDACELRGENWNPTRQYGCIHAYVAEVPPKRCEKRLSAWDEQGTLLETLALSRLIHPNAGACDYAVRRIIGDDDREQLAPYDAGTARVAFRIEDGSAGWLTASEAEELADLLRSYSSATLPLRVGRALYLSETLVRQEGYQDALPLLVTGIEALLKVGRRHLSEQFAQRTSALAAEVGIQITTARCVQAYDDRSAQVHGGFVSLAQPVEHDEFRDVFDQLQQTLRRAIRKAIEDPAFAAVFDDDTKIKQRWPTRITPKNGSPFLT
ncbi:MAG TPA: hypothetical protein VFF79_09170 [Conexibacter sp.]|nr:hypothetical protein [Conexibacter sp.]